MFPDWSEADVLYALQETNGDENEAVARIAEGTSTRAIIISTQPQHSPTYHARCPLGFPSNSARPRRQRKI
jgi:hypothetical protein